MYCCSLFLGYAMLSNAQVKTSITAGFEKNGAAWETAAPDYLSVVDSKSAEGVNSLEYRVDTPYKPSAIVSIDTRLTIMKVRSAVAKSGNVIVGSSYEGIVLGVGYDGVTLWKTDIGHGLMNHDMWCADITGDGVDEIMVACADGKVYCLNDNGKVMWQFQPNNGGQLPPMYAVCVVHGADKTPYVVCGGFDMSIYYLSATGQLVKELKSSVYSTVKPWGDAADTPPSFLHNANFLRPMVQPNGTEVLVMHASNNHMQSTGTIYLFTPLSNTPYRTIEKIPAAGSIGDMRIEYRKSDGKAEILLGANGLSEMSMTRVNPETGVMEEFSLTSGIGSPAYRVNQVVTIPSGDSTLYFNMFGLNVILVGSSLSTATDEIIAGNYSYNDMWKDGSGRIILASSESGGSCIHLIDIKNTAWKSAIKSVNPPGKIQSILDNFTACRSSLSGFVKPAWERDPDTVYIMSADLNNALTKSLIGNYASPVFLGGSNEDRELYDVVHSAIPDPIYSVKRDVRQTYSLTSNQAVSAILSNYANVPGIGYWIGHGNDPYYYSKTTTQKVIDGANGKKTVMIIPEMHDTYGSGKFVVNDLLLPLCEYGATRNANLILQNKDIFWQCDVYTPDWKEGISGKYAKALLPSMEETTDKTQDLSLMGRMGLWASGATDNWASRCSRDNPSFDRSRQFSNQSLPNHFLRATVYNLACGSRYVNNTYVDLNHMGLALELMAKGALYVPRRNEIVSFSPVHLSMKNPDARYIKEGTNGKWTTFYDRNYEENNSYVFSRMNGTWLGAPVNYWDFSRYASGVIDRRQNFLPPYPNGMVLITPPQAGVFADATAVRGSMSDLLHPLYKNILKEFITDGHNYYSANGLQTYKANEYYTTVEAAIKEGAQKLPLTVSGSNVAWVVAQTSPMHLRLTLVDGGYINPDNRMAKITFHSVQPKKMTDVLDKKVFNITNPSAVMVDIPCGLFRFIDIELSKPL